MIEGDFFFQGVARWNLGWTTPNYAGAFLAMLLPWVWEAEHRSIKRRHIWIALLALEATGWFLLCMTFSRGALIAAAAAVLWWSGTRVLRARERTRMILSEIAVRMVAITSLLLLTGFIGRITPNYTGVDESIGNRLDLWRGGLEMIAAAPWRGWGAGESGRAYMNWYQPIGETEVFTTMVNSYLHIAVEYGLPVLAGVLALLCAILLLGWGAASRGYSQCVAAGASLVVWCVANVFTTLWIEPKLWVVPGIAAAVIVWHAYRVRRFYPMKENGTQDSVGPHWGWRSIFSISVVMAILALFYVAGSASAKRYPWRVISENSETTVLLPRAQGGTAPVSHVWADPAVFGPTPGQELRRWAEADAVELHVHRPSNRKLAENAKEGRLILSGLHAGRLERESISNGIRELWLLHPSSQPPKDVPKTLRIVVLLPAVDETGLNNAWRTWAASAHAQVLESANSGSDLRSAWPNMSLRGMGT